MIQIHNTQSAIKAEDMDIQNYVFWFHEIINASIALYFKNECKFVTLEEVEPPLNDNWITQNVNIPKVGFDEKVVIMLALMPCLHPQALDIFFAHNKNFDRPYTEFGGWKGNSHAGFLPTGETAAFLLAGENDFSKRRKVIRLFEKDHWFYTHNVLRLEGAGEGEPFLSGQLRISDEFLCKVLHNKTYKPDYSIGFPAKLLITPLEWEDMVLDNMVVAELEEINTWIRGHHTIMEDWGLSRYLKAGYRSLFYGPPGTGKTLAAALIGKRNNMDVYRVDLSMVVSKYIGETEKNLARVFDIAENRDWILFFDEADALFGKRTSSVQSSNDRHANQEVAYLLQRIEDFAGTVILASNLRSNLDEAFSRRFQSAIYFPMPTKELRMKLWENMLPKNWLGDDKKELISFASEKELSGGAIANVIRRCALWRLDNGGGLEKGILEKGIEKELLKN